MIYELLSKLDRAMGFEEAKAHCDIPCGIYDPHAAEIAALTIIRMIDLAGELKNTHPEGTPDYLLSFDRYVMVKEDHGEKLKHEIRVIYGDYIKQDMITKYPELPGLVHNIMQLASKARQTMDRGVAVQLLQQVNRFAEIFWETKGVKTKRVKAPYKPGEEMVLPEL